MGNKDRDSDKELDDFARELGAEDAQDLRDKIDEAEDDKE